MRSYIVFGVVMLIIASVVWVGMSLYSSVADVEISPNAENFVKPINPQFDVEMLNSIIERNDKLTVKTEIFHSLEDQAQSEESAGDQSIEEQQ